MMHPYRRGGYLLGGGAAALVALVLMGCPLERKSPEGAAQAPGTSAAAPPPVIEAAPVLAAVAVEKEIPIVVRAIGAVEAASTVMIKAQVSGELLAAHFQEGQTVKKGDALFTLDSRTYAAALKEAEAKLAKDQAELKNAQQEATRYQSLAERKAVAQEQFEAAQTRALSLAASTQADMASIEMAKLNIEFCQIRSPLTGRAGSLEAHVGNLIKANADTALVTIHQLDPIQTTFSIPEQNLGELRRRMAEGKLKVEATIPGETEPAVGELTFVDNAVSGDTGTIRLKATFDNSAGRLWPGQFVNVRLRLSAIPKAVVVPLQAVQTGQKGQFVYVIKADQTAEYRAVTPGPTVGAETAILNGLAAGESVVTDGHLRVLPGKPVAVKEGTGPKPVERAS